MTEARQNVLADLGSRITGLHRSHPIRVAIDGVDAAGKTTLADGDHFDFSIFVRANFDVTTRRAEPRDQALFGSIDEVARRYRERCVPGMERLSYRSSEAEGGPP